MNEKFSLLLSAGKYHTYNVPAYNSQNFCFTFFRQYSVDLTSHIYDFDLKTLFLSKKKKYPGLFLLRMGKEAVVERRLKGLEFSVARTIGRFSFAGSYTFIDSRVRLGKKELSFCQRYGLYHPDLHCLAYSKSMEYRDKFFCTPGFILHPC